MIDDTTYKAAFGRLKVAFLVEQRLRVKAEARLELSQFDLGMKTEELDTAKNSILAHFRGLALSGVGPWWKQAVDVIDAVRLSYEFHRELLKAAVSRENCWRRQLKQRCHDLKQLRRVYDKAREMILDSASLPDGACTSRPWYEKIAWVIQEQRVAIQVLSEDRDALALQVAHLRCELMGLRQAMK